jgi:transcriptional regulator with XRE-family HTH domain
MSIGENVQKARLAKRMSREKLAQAVNCSAATIVRLEDENVPGGVLRLQAIARALDVPVGTLMDD